MGVRATNDRRAAGSATGPVRLPPDRVSGAKGFSLIEVMIVVAIFGILVTLAVSSYTTWSARYRVETDTKELFMELTDARTRAMQRNRVHFATLAATSVQIHEDTNTPPDGNGALETGADTRLRTRTIATTLNPPGISPIRFNTDGTLALEGGSATAVIRITPPPGVSADYDCISLGRTRIKMGLFTGGACAEK